MNTFDSCQLHINGHSGYCLVCENEALRAKVKPAAEEEAKIEERIEKLIARLEEAMGVKDDHQGHVLAAQD